MVKMMTRQDLIGLLKQAVAQEKQFSYCLAIEAKADVVNHLVAATLSSLNDSLYACDGVSVWIVPPPYGVSTGVPAFNLCDELIEFFKQNQAALDSLPRQSIDRHAFFNYKKSYTALTILRNWEPCQR